MILPSLFAVNFYIINQDGLFARRILCQVPSLENFVVLNDKRYKVHKAEWCLDDNATNHQYQALVNIELIKQTM